MSTTSTPSTTANSGDFEKVIRFVSTEIIEYGKTVPMRTIHNIYKLSIEDTRYRHKLKQRLINHFGESLEFLFSREKNCELVASSKCIDGTFTCNEDIVKNAAKIIRSEIKRKLKETPELNWPPTSHELSQDERKPPQILYTFLKELMKK